MSAIKVSEAITFHYTDSGPVERTPDGYITIIMVHGHSFHSGIFSRLLPLAESFGLRIICVSRRGYLGSTPYTSEEQEMLNSTSVKRHEEFLSLQGHLLALFVDGVIQQHALPEKGGIALLGWSMGNLFTLGVLTAVDTLPSDAKDRLKRYLHTFICWDSPSVAFGIPAPEGSYSPLWITDPSVTPQERGKLFSIWVSGYFQHGDLTTRTFSQLEQRLFDTQFRKPTVATMSNQDIQSVIDGAVGLQFDSPLILAGNFERALWNQTSKALFDPRLRTEWKRLTNICCMYAENSIWLVLFALWELEERAKRAGIYYRPISGANHFMMWDQPEVFMSSLKEIVSQSQYKLKSSDSKLTANL